MDAGNADLWRAEVEAVTKAALAAPGANQPVAFTAGLLAALLAMNQKASTLGLAFAEEALLKHAAAAPGAMPDLNALVEPLAVAIERAVDLRVEALRAQLLEELRR